MSSAPLYLIVPYTLLLMLRLIIIEAGGSDLHSVWPSGVAGSFVLTQIALLLRAQHFNSKVHEPLRNLQLELAQLGKETIKLRRSQILIALNHETKLIVIILATIFGFSSALAANIATSGSWAIASQAASGMLFGGTAMLALALARLLAKIPGGEAAIRKLALASNLLVGLVSLPTVLLWPGDFMLPLPFSLVSTLVCVACYRLIRRQLEKLEFTTYLEHAAR